MSNESLTKMGSTKRNLTPKQEAFCQAVASGSSYSQAYRSCYQVNGGDSMVHRESSRLMSDPKITTRIDQIVASKEKAIARKAVSDRDRVLGKLREWLESDIDSTTGEQPSAAQLQAANLLGKSVALFTDRLEQKTDDRSADEIAEEIQRKIEALTDRPLH